MDPNSAYALVLDTLHRATDQNVEILKPATANLSEWEKEPGFYSILMTIFTNHNHDPNARSLAVMCMKTGVNRYWKGNNRVYSLSKEEKDRIREGLLSSAVLNEPVKAVIVQLGVVISQVARHDYPADWPKLLPTLLNVMKSSVLVEQHHSLLIFYQVVKVLSTKRLLSDRRTFQDLTMNVYSYMLNVWDEYTQNFLRLIQQSAETEIIVQNLEKAVFCLKVLHKFTIFGIKKLHENRDAMNFLNIVFERAKTTLECRKMLKGRGVYVLELSEKFIILLTKILNGTVEGHSASCNSDFVRLVVEFCTFYAFTEQGSALAFGRFTIQCLNLLKAILLCAEFKEFSKTKAKDVERANRWDTGDIFSEEMIRHMCRHLVTNFFLLSSDDLALWDVDPESFAFDDSRETWKGSLRPCVESLFVALFREFRYILIPELISLIEIVKQQPINPDDFRLTLYRDAVYNAVGLSAFELYGVLDFDNWFLTSLVRELNVKGENYKIVRRRVAWVMGKWSNVKDSSELHPVFYQHLLELLKPEEDMAVRLAACDAIYEMVVEFNFDKEQFTPFLGSFFSLLFHLLKEAEECDTKMHVLSVLSSIVERNEDVVVDCMDNLLGYLPELWEHAAQHNMLKCAIVLAMVKIVTVIGSWDTPTMKNMVLSVLDEATDMSKTAHVYLLEDGLKLWDTVLACSPSPPHSGDELLRLAYNLPVMLDQSTEYIKSILDVINNYLLLMPEPFLMGAGAKCMAIMDGMLSDLLVEGVVVILKVVEMCLILQLPGENGMLGVKVVWPIIQRILKDMTTLDESFPTLLSLQMTIIFRLLLKSSHLFSEAFREAAGGGDPVEFLSKVLNVCCSRLPLVTQVQHRKLIGLGLSALLTSQIMCVIEQFPVIMVNMTEILNDVMKTDSNGQQIDLLLASQDEQEERILDFSICVETHQFKRLRNLLEVDVVETVDIKQFLTSKLEELKSQVGPEYFNQMMQSIPPATVQQLQEYIVFS